jgi:hypothetical protein
LPWASVTVSYTSDIAWHLKHIVQSALKAMYMVQFFLQLAMQFYSWEMLISEISEEFSICWENISGV